MDFDGLEEHVVMGKNLLVVLDKKGGALCSLNYLPTGWNYGDTFTGSILDEHVGFLGGVSAHGGFKHSFADSIMCTEYDLLSLDRNSDSYIDCGSMMYDIVFCDKSGTEILTTTDTPGVPGTHVPVRVYKRYRLRTTTIVVEYTLVNTGSHGTTGKFGSEMNLSIGTRDGNPLLSTVEKSRNRSLPSGRSVTHGLSNVRIPDEVNRTIISFASDARFSLYRHDTTMRIATAMGLEVLYQHTTTMPVWDFDLDAGESFSWTIGFRIERRSKQHDNKEQDV
jgi:hypothetical protein